MSPTSGSSAGAPSVRGPPSPGGPDSASPVPGGLDRTGAAKYPKMQDPPILLVGAHWDLFHRRCTTSASAEGRCFSSVMGASDVEYHTGSHFARCFENL